MSAVPTPRLVADPITFTLFDGVKSTSGKRSTMPWSSICSMLAHPKEYPGIEVLPLIAFAIYPGETRAKGVQPDQFTAVVGDYDAGRVSPADAVARLRAAGILAFVHTTRRHTREAPRWRVIVPLSAPVDAAQYRKLVDELNGVLGGVLAPESWDVKRPYFYGRVRGVEYVAETIDGECIDKLARHSPSWKPIGKPSTCRPAPPISRRPTRGDDPIDRFVSDETVEELRSALNAIPADDRDLWIRMGHALYGLSSPTHPDAGRELWLEEWSPTSYKHDPERDAQTWETLRGDRTGYAAVFAEAQRRGWVNPRAGATHAETYDVLIAEIAAAPADAAGDPRFVTEMITRLAKANLSGVQEELLLKRLSKLAGVRLASLRYDLKNARTAAAEDLGGTHADYANALLLQLATESGDVAPVGVEGNIYTVGADGIWRGRPAASYEVEVGRLFSGHPRCERRNDYTSIALHAYEIAARGNAEFFADAPIGLACPNGMFYRIDGNGDLCVEPVTPGHRQRFQAAASPQYMPSPIFEKYLQDTFASDIEGECASQIRLLQEVAGAALMGLLARHEKAVLVLGPGRAGKGTFLRIMEAAVPAEWRAAMSPFKWDEEYYLASLAGKRLNVVGELPQDAPIPAAEFKTVIGRDLLCGRHPSAQPFTFRNEAAHIFNSNHFVRTRDHSDAFFSRWIIIVFGNSRIASGDIDIDLAERIIRQDLPGVLWWMLEGARRLVARGRFELTRSHHETMARWRCRTNSLLEFLQDPDYCELRPAEADEAPVRRSELFTAYMTYCSHVGRKAMSKQRVFEELDSPAVAALGLKVRRHMQWREVVDGLQWRRHPGLE